MDSSLLLLLCLSFTLVLVWHRIRSRHQALPLPPGPRGGLFTGVKSQLPKSEPWKTYAAWGTQFGGEHESHLLLNHVDAAELNTPGTIVCFRVYNRLTCVLTTPAAVHDLLEKRAAIYSGRPMSWMFQAICGRAHAVFNVSSEHPRHRVYRRLLQSGLSANVVKSYWPILEEETEVLIRGLTETPEQYEKHIRRNATAVIMKVELTFVAFGYTISGHDDPFISIAEQSSKISGWAMAPGRWLVDYWPILRFIPSWFPLAHFKRQGAEWRGILNSVSEVPHNWVKSQIARRSNSSNPSFAKYPIELQACGTNVPSFTSRLLRAGMSEEEEDIVKWCAGALYAGAADTVRTTDSSIALCFLTLNADRVGNDLVRAPDRLHPSVQQRAQAEIASAIPGSPGS
ncbi:cytochrome P450 [Mycena sp. CBHHK59/15]|nr:cytochrome P450 [Mycena sp. CBHHK59/15]